MYFILATGRSQGQGAVRMLILDLAGTTTYRKLFHLLKVNCFRTSQITYGRCMKSHD